MSANIRVVSCVFLLSPSLAVAGDYEDGVDAFNRLDFNKAIACLTRHIEANLNDAAAYAKRGAAYFEKRDFDNALPDCTKAIELDPKNSSARYYRGGVYFIKEEFDKAITDFTEAIRLDPKNALVFFSRGSALFRKHERDRAIADFTEAIRLDPKLTFAYVFRADTYTEKKEYDKAIKDLTEAIRQDPKDYLLFMKRGDGYIAIKEHDKAFADYTEAIRLDPKYPAPHIARANAYFLKQAYDKAIADYTAAIALKPRYQPKDYELAGVPKDMPYTFPSYPYYRRGVAYARTKEYDKAIADFTESIRLNPKDSRSQSYFAWVLATCPRDGLRDGKRAVELATQACELTKWKEARPVDALAAAHAERGDFPEAVKWQKKALEIGLPMEQLERARMRLKLYEEGKPYREP
jgi:tetratricopeptide (TPR) repeat protein